MRNNENTPLGNTKKFLYTGPKKEENNDDQWIFTPRKDQTPTAGNHSELDDVWSIKKNVSVSGGKPKPLGSEGLNLKANTTYYSRYGGVKEKEEANRQLLSSNSNRSANHPGGLSTWNSNYPAKGFSYSSFGGEKTETRSSPQSTVRPNQAYSFTNTKDSSLW